MEDDIRNEIGEVHSKEDIENVLVMDEFLPALMGVGRQAGGEMTAVYDFWKMAHVCVKKMGMSAADAYEYLEFNTLSAYVGPHTPIIVTILPDELEAWFDVQPDTKNTESSS